jgi:hypothetical protein
VEVPTMKTRITDEEWHTIRIGVETLAALNQHETLFDYYVTLLGKIKERMKPNEWDEVLK